MRVNANVAVAQQLKKKKSHSTCRPPEAMLSEKKFPPFSRENEKLKCRWLLCE